jgi:hypothetical protein
LEIAVRPNTADLAEGPRQGTLIDAGNAAYISHMSEISHICARDMLETIHNLSIPLDSLFRRNRASTGYLHRSAPLVRVN